jgi:hypothetical protein
MAGVSAATKKNPAKKGFLVHSLGALRRKLRQPAQKVADSRGTTPSSPNNCMEVGTSKLARAVTDLEVDLAYVVFS